MNFDDAPKFSQKKAIKQKEKEGLFVRLFVRLKYLKFLLYEYIFLKWFSLYFAKLLGRPWIRREVGCRLYESRSARHDATDDTSTAECSRREYVYYLVGCVCVDIFIIIAKSFRCNTWKKRLVTRIFLKQRPSPRKRPQYSEGWIEFADRRVAKLIWFVFFVSFLSVVFRKNKNLVSQFEHVVRSFVV